MKSCFIAVLGFIVGVMFCCISLLVLASITPSPDIPTQVATIANTEIILTTTPTPTEGISSLHEGMTLIVGHMTQTAEASVQPVFTTLQPKPTIEMTGVGMTRSQANAVKSAQSYIRYSSFSRSGLINQLVFEQYSVADAEFAVKFINVDWTEQAYLTAKSYLSYSAFSLPELILQLEFEGFTAEQATAGATRAYSE